jgi:heme-degrading monooxygenase HmoA
MHAQVTTYQVQPGKIEERHQHGWTVSRPKLREQPGFRGILVLVDRAAHKSMSLSLWEAEGHRRAARKNPTLSGGMTSRKFVAGPVNTKDFEVIEYMPGSNPGAAKVARVIAYHVQSGRMEERLRRQPEQMCPAFHALPGFQGHVFVVDRASHRSLSVTLWETEAQRQTMVSDAAVSAARPHQHFGAGEMTVENFEVAEQGLIG